MTTDHFSFTVNATDGAARTGEIRMPRGVIRTPAFMPVGTAATVKALDPEQGEPLGARGVVRTPACMPGGAAAAVKAMYPEQVKALGADVVLGNVYHLMLRPGAERVARLGGLRARLHRPLPP